MKRLRLGLLKLSKKEEFLLNSLAALVGILGGFAAILFRHLIGFFENLVFHHQIGFDLISPLQHELGATVIIVPAIGMVIVAYLTHWFAPEAKGHGVPEVIQAVMSRGGIIRKRIVAIKALASAITIGSGGSLGREGPIVQIGSATGSTLGQFLKLKPSMIKTLVGCGAAAAVAATFNTPIAGVIFAIEIIVLEFKTNSFIPLVIAAVFGTVLSRYYLGNEPAFEVPQYSFGNPLELTFYLGLGVLAGIVGVIFTKTVYFTEDQFDQSTYPLYLKAFVGGLVLGIMGYYYPQVFGVGYETMSDAIHQNSIFHLMFLLIFLKIAAVSITLAAGGSGGIFAPSLFIGAMLGGSYGFLVNQAFPEMAPNYGAYAMIGMAAMLSATTRAAFTSIVVLFEMTLNYSIILPLMFACVISSQVAWLISKLDMYSLKLQRKGIYFDHDMGVNIHNITRVKEIMTKSPIVFKDTMNLSEALKVFIDHPHSFFPLVNEDHEPLGIIRASTIRKAKEEHGPKASISKLRKLKPKIVDPDQPVSLALKQIENARDPRLLVVSPVTNRVLGIISPKNIMELSLRDRS